MSSIRVTTNFRDNLDIDLGDKLITKDYLMSVYPGIAQEIGKTPELWVWGSNNSVQLGVNNTTNTSTPVTTFAGGTNWKQVSATLGHMSAIKTDGTLWTWGYAINGQLGNAQRFNVSTPVTVFGGGTNWKQVTTGGNLTAAIKTDGTLWTWGSPTSGVLGNGATIGNISTPVTTFAGGNNWKQVTTGGNHTAAIKTDGTLWTWGSSSGGRLGNAASTASISTPVTTFAGGTNWKQVSSSGYHTTALKTDGTLWTWGLGLYGGLGNGITTGTISTPITTFAGGNNWKQVTVFNRITAAIKTDGTLWVWGSGLYGALGNGITTGTISTPITTFAGGTNWKQVNAGTRCIAAIKTDGTLWLWGTGSGGRLGNGITTDVSTPITTFAGGTNWKQVSGKSSTAAIESADFI